MRRAGRRAGRVQHRAEGDPAPAGLDPPPRRAVEDRGEVDLAQRPEVGQRPRSRPLDGAADRHAPRRRIGGRRRLAEEGRRRRDAAGRQLPRAGEPPGAGSQAIERGPTRGRATRRPRRARRPPAPNVARQEPPVPLGRRTGLSSRQRRGSRWNARIGSRTRPAHAWRVMTVHAPTWSGLPSATHAKPPPIAATATTETARPPARRHHDPRRTAAGSERRSLSATAAARQPPITPWATKSHAASGDPARSDRSPVAAIAATRIGEEAVEAGARHRRSRPRGRAVSARRADRRACSRTGSSRAGARRSTARGRSAGVPGRGAASP